MAAQYIEQASRYIEKLAAEYRDYKPGRPLDQLIYALGPKSDPRRALEGLRAQPPRLAVRTRTDNRTLDQLIADLGNRNLSVDRIFGRDGSNR